MRGILLNVLVKSVKHSEKCRKTLCRLFPNYAGMSLNTLEEVVYNTLQ